MADFKISEWSFDEPQFITQELINYLKTNRRINFEDDFPVFIRELTSHLVKNWDPSKMYELEPLKKGDIIKFNQIIRFHGGEGLGKIKMCFIRNPPLPHEFCHNSRVLLYSLYRI